MELFGVIGWISVPQFILQYIREYLTSSTGPVGLGGLLANELLYWYITLGVGGGLYLLGLIFGGLGLRTLARRAGVKHAWMGFLPFANTYLAGKLAGETNIFGTRVKRIGLYTMLCEIAFVLLNIFSVALQIYVLTDANFYVEVESSGGSVFTLSQEAMQLAGVGWVYSALRYYVLDIVIYIFSLVMIFMFCTLFFAFFRKYYARSPFMMTFLCAVLPARGFVLFAVRNNSPVDYNAIMRQRMQRQQQMYGDPYGEYPGQRQPQSPPAPPEEPFGDEFGGHTPPSAPPDDNPFSDF